VREKISKRYMQKEGLREYNQSYLTQRNWSRLKEEKKRCKSLTTTRANTKEMRQHTTTADTR